MSEIIQKNNQSSGWKRLTIENVRETFNREGCKLMSTKYINNRQNLKYICKNGHKTTMNYHEWTRSKYKCTQCSNNQRGNSTRFSYDFVKEVFEKKNFQLISKNYVNNITKLDYICDKGHKGSMIFTNFYNGQYGCNECGYIKYTIDEIKEIFLEDGYILLSTEYIHNKKKLECVCPKNHNCRISLYSYNQGVRCGVCYLSRGEQLIQKHLEKNDMKFVQQKKFDMCKDSNALPFDFYVEDKFLIEFDGKQHFESIEFFGGNDKFIKCQQHDIIKTNYCRKNNIPLLRIAYLDMADIPNIIDAYICYLQKNDSYIHFSNDKLYSYTT